jgi:hypothetical protein
MAEEKIVEGEAKVVEKKPAAKAAPKEAPEAEAKEESLVTASKPLDPRASAAAIKDAVESMGKVVTSALQDRANVVMVRVNDETLRHMDMLVEAEITKSRSESAALLISEGIKANMKLYEKISSITDQIANLRAELRESLQK